DSKDNDAKPNSPCCPSCPYCPYCPFCPCFRLSAPPQQPAAARLDPAAVQGRGEDLLHALAHGGGDLAVAEARGDGAADREAIDLHPLAHHGAELLDQEFLLVAAEVGRGADPQVPGAGDDAA